ncbi:MAG: VanZ family protein [Thermoguttaceae bacterium]
MRLISIAYLVFLTLLLLTADPSRVVGANIPLLLRRLMPEAHLLSFFVLAILALGSRWPAPRWIVVSLLGLYGAMTEIGQGFVPQRTPDWADWFQDMAGVALGAALCWGVMRLAGRWTRRRLMRECAGCPPGAND